MRHRVLVVVESEAVLLTLKMVLENAGYHVEGTNNYEEALRISRRPDLLICDAVLGRKDGPALAIRLREKFPACKVLMFAGTEQEYENIRAAARFGYCFAKVPKPLSPRHLLHCVSDLLTERMQERFA